MSDSTEHQAESKRAEQLRRRLADVVLMRHEVENLWRRYEAIMPEWTSPRSKAWDPSSSDLAAWVAGVNKLNNAFDALLDTEAVISAGILDLEAGATTTDADDGEAPECDEDRERLTARMLSCIKQLDTGELATLVRVTSEHLDDPTGEAEQGGDRL